MHVITSLLVVTSLVGCTYAQEDFNVPVNLGNGATLQWAYNGFSITFKVFAPTFGWVGIGISSDGTMHGSDLMMAGVYDNRKPYVFDGHGIGNKAPLLDRSPDISIIEGTEISSGTTVVLKRAFEIDDLDDISIKPGKVNVIWAFGQKDLRGQPTRADYHSRNRGSKSLELIPASPSGNAAEPASPMGPVGPPRRTLVNRIETGGGSDLAPFPIEFFTPPAPTPDKARNLVPFPGGIFPSQPPRVATSGTVKSQVFIFPFIDSNELPSMETPSVRTRPPPRRTPRVVIKPPTQPPTIPPSGAVYRPTNRPTVVNTPRITDTPRTNRPTTRRTPRTPVVFPTNRPTGGSEPRVPSSSRRPYTPQRIRPTMRQTTRLPPRPSTENPYASFTHQNSVTLDRYGLVILHWSLFGGDLVIEMVAPTLGWIGVGFSPSGTMAGADMIIMGVRNNRGYVLDTYASQNGIPSEDDSQDADVLSATQNSTFTRVMVLRRSNEADVEDMKLRPGKMNVIWAFGPNDVREMLRTNNYHSNNRGLKQIEFIPGPPQPNGVVSGGEVGPDVPRLPETSEGGTIVDGRLPETPESSIGGPNVVSVPRTTQQPEPGMSGQDAAEGRSAQAFALTGTQILDRARMVTLRWGRLGKSMVFEMTAPTLGWLGIGFSESGTMAEADLILAGSRPSGPYILDAFSRQNGVPTVEGTNDVTLLSFRENGTHTNIMFMREQNTGDENDVELKAGRMNVIWAFGKTDIIRRPSAADYHLKNRGSMMVTFFPGESKQEMPKNNKDEMKTVTDEKGEGKTSTVLPPPSPQTATITSTATTTTTTATEISDMEEEKAEAMGEESTEDTESTMPPATTTKNDQMTQKEEDIETDDAKESRTVAPTPLTEMVDANHMAGKNTVEEPHIRVKSQESVVGGRSLVLAPQPTMIDIANLVELAEGVVLRWGYDESYIVMEITAPTLGWVGVGFSPSGVMGDIYMVGSGENGGYLWDCHAFGNGVPTVDAQSDVMLMSHNETDTHTTVVIKRKLDTMDENDVMLEDAEVFFLWAYGKRDAENGPTRALYHYKNRGLKKMNLLSQKMEENESPSDYRNAVATTAAIAIIILGLAAMSRRM